MPKSGGDVKEQISIKIPPKLRGQAEALAELQGVDVSSVYLDALQIGLSQQYEQDTKFRVHAKVMKGLEDQSILNLMETLVKLQSIVQELCDRVENLELE